MIPVRDSLLQRLDQNGADARAKLCPDRLNSRAGNARPANERFASPRDNLRFEALAPPESAHQHHVTFIEFKFWHAY